MKDLKQFKILFLVFIALLICCSCNLIQNKNTPKEYNVSFFRQYNKNKQGYDLFLRISTAERNMAGGSTINTSAEINGNKAVVIIGEISGPPPGAAVIAAFVPAQDRINLNYSDSGEYYLDIKKNNAIDKYRINITDSYTQIEPLKLESTQLVDAASDNVVKLKKNKYVIWKEPQDMLQIDCSEGYCQELYNLLKQKGIYPLTDKTSQIKWFEEKYNYRTFYKYSGDKENIVNIFKEFYDQHPNIEMTIFGYLYDGYRINLVRRLGKQGESSDYSHVSGAYENILW